jgi:peptide/nickel transport system substrate-binding protein
VVTAKSNSLGDELEGVRQAVIQSARLTHEQPRQRIHPRELVIRPTALLAAIAVSLLAVSGAGEAATQLTPERGGTLAFGGRIGEPPCLNVLVSSCNESGTTSMIAEMILQPAFDVGPGYTFRPRLVSRVAFTRQPPFTLTYHIRPRAQWSDGTPVTAQDFKFTHQARLDVRAKLPVYERRDESRIRSVTAVDAKTVRVVLRSRWSGWRTLFANVLPSHVLRGENLTKIWAHGIDNPKTGQRIGSGPFLLGSWERGRQLTLIRNPRYWGPHTAYLDRIVIRFTTAGENPVDLFRSGELHVADALNPGDATALRREGVTVLAGPSGIYQHLAFRIGPGGNLALRRDRPGSRLIRRAIAFGIDRVALVSAVWNDVAPNLRPLQSVVFLAQSPYYRRDFGSYGYDPTRARGLLEQAGCRRGPDGIYSCGGVQLSLRFVTPAGFPSRERLLLLMQEQLERIGVEVIPTYAVSAAFYGTILPSGEFDVALFGWDNSPDPTGMKSIYGCEGAFNYTGYCQRLVTADLDEADRILDAGQQARVLNRADAQIARDLPVLPLFQVPEPTAVRDTVKNFAQSYRPLTTSENWWLDR